jgi:hypothetical protein
MRLRAPIVAAIESTGSDEMNERYLYGSRPAAVTAAGGVSGVLLRGVNGGFTFRVYRKPGEFTDYEIRHDELSVMIDGGELAAFYEVGEERVLDHSPQVLGLERAEGNARQWQP